jgi:hypothetical protein
MGSRNQVGIGLLYRPASLCSLATQFQTRFLESIPRPIAGLKFLTLVSYFSQLCGEPVKTQQTLRKHRLLILGIISINKNIYKQWR